MSDSHKISDRSSSRAANELKDLASDKILELTDPEVAVDNPELPAGAEASAVAESADSPAGPSGGADIPADILPSSTTEDSDSSTADSTDSSDSIEGLNIPSVLPVLPLRDTVVFNSMIIPLFENREKGMETLELALNGSRYLLLCAQRDSTAEDPVPGELYDIGAVVMILRMIKVADGQVKLLIQGLARAHADEFDMSGPVLMARVNVLEEKRDVSVDVSDVEVEAMMRNAREQSERILQLRGLPSGEIMGVLNGVTEPGRLADIIATNMRLSVPDGQRLLECLDPVERLRLVNGHLLREVEIAAMQAHIQNMAREGMDKAQKEYFLREQLKAIHKELRDGSDDESEQETLRKALDKAGLPAYARKEADKQLRRLASMHGDSSEANVIRTYLDLLTELPWKKLSRDRLDIVKASAILDEDHFGLEKVKDRILEFLSVRKLNPDSKGQVLCFAGPPGVGKTSLGR
ncbi:MAG: LON peptidase substrate-binding domain-containing protein, partial [Mailhella sp.]|nr:LON peptidase substrate-binding domain-containing protein [Mailhella sp.]